MPAIADLMDALNSLQQAVNKKLVRFQQHAISD